MSLQTENEQLQIRMGEMAAEIERLNAAQQSPAAAVAGHVIAKTINDLRDVAVKYHGAQQLREQIASIIRPLLKPSPLITEQDFREIAVDFDAWNCQQHYLGNYSEWYEAEGRALLNKLNDKPIVYVDHTNTKTNRDGSLGSPFQTIAEALPVKPWDKPESVGG